MTAEDLSKKARFYRLLEVRLAGWTLLALGIGLTLTLPSAIIAVSSMGGMLVILKLAMKDPVYIRIRTGASASS